MQLTKDKVLSDIAMLPTSYKTADVDRLIRDYVRQKADPTALRPFLLSHPELHRIYFYVALKQIPSAEGRMAFIHENLLFNDWWHTDQLIGFVSELDFQTALEYGANYTKDPDPFIRRWGYVLFISPLGRGRGKELLPLMRNDDHYSVQMAQGWLTAELAVSEPELVYDWLVRCDLKYNITGKAVQKILDSFRISKEWKERFRALRPMLREKGREAIS